MAGRFPVVAGGGTAPISIPKPLDLARAAAGSRFLRQQEPKPVPEPVREGGRRRFGAAAGEVLLLEVVPWVYDRYIANYDFARISFSTIKTNFKTGFQYDSDDFQENQSSHPYHGGLFFNAARDNGYTYWESGAFTLAGSLIWECCMENTAPSINDLVNTTLGGMTRGEVAHRLSAMILDNHASGLGRVVREAAAAVIDPTGSFNRLIRGEMFRDFDNPYDRFPSGVIVAVDLGYRHVAGETAPHENQGMLSLSVLYGDPFEGDITKPFDSFWVGLDANVPGVLLSRIEERGVLKGWELTDRSDSIRHIFGFSQEYEYLNNASQVFGAQLFSMGLLSKISIRPGLVAANDASVLLIPLSGIKTIDFAATTTGRNYDYAPGAGARVAARLYAGAREILGLGYGIVWAHTVNGVSDNNTLQFFRATGRIPLSKSLSAGAGYSWYSRKTTYAGFFEPRRTQSEWRAFVSWAVPYH